MDSKHGFGDLARLLKRYKEQTADLVEEVNARSMAEEKFGAIFENSPIPIAIAESDTRISMINDAFCKAIGYQGEEIINTPWIKYIHPDYVDLMMDYNKRRKSDPQDPPAVYELDIVRKGGEIQRGKISIAFIRSTGQSVAIFSDIFPQNKDSK